MLHLGLRHLAPHLRVEPLVLVGGGIGFIVALLGAWHGEKLMGNLGDDPKRTARGKLRAAMWEEDLSGLPRVDRDRIE